MKLSEGAQATLYGATLAAYFVAPTVLLVALVTSAWACSPAQLAALQPLLPVASSLVDRALADRGSPVEPGACVGVPPELTDNEPAAYALCRLGTGWMGAAAKTLRATAWAAGERLDEGKAVCLPLQEIEHAICRAPYDDPA